ncbi:MAG TPA: outer membrane beta-barrel protein [bacterium]|nr:outer membrane beta-barrel protein [bacterium]
MRKVLVVLLLLLMVAALAEAPRKPISGFAVGLFGGYWVYSGPSYLFNDGAGGSLRVGYRFKPGELEIYGFFEYTNLLMTDIWQRWDPNPTGSLVTFGISPRISFSPTTWISPYFGAGPAFTLRTTSLDIERQSGDLFNYFQNAQNFAVFVEVGAEFPLQPSVIIEVGCHYIHPFTPEEERFSGITAGAGVSFFF